MNNSVFTKYISFGLKVVGISLILGGMVDYFALTIPFKSDTTWQYNTIANIVDRGIVPLMGIVLFLVGSWIKGDDPEVEQQPRRRKFQAKLPILLLATLLGLMFLLFIPLQVKNVLSIVDAQNSKISKQAQEAEQRIQEQYDQLYALSQKPEDIKKLEETLKNIDQALKTGQWQGQALNDQQKQELIQRKEQYTQYQNLTKDPKALEARLNQLQSDLKQKTNQAQQQTNRGVYKQGLRIILNSIILTVAYSAIGWAGLKATVGFKGLTNLLPKKKLKDNTTPKAKRPAVKPTANTQQTKKTAPKVTRPQVNTKSTAKSASATKVSRPKNPGSWFNKSAQNKQASNDRANNPSEELNLIEPEITSDRQIIDDSQNQQLPEDKP